jgi:hypothetical protein
MLIGTDPDQVPTNADLGELAYLDANYVLPAAGGTMTGAINLTANSGYNIYASGTAGNYLAGSLGIGSTSLTGYSIRVGKAATGNVDSVGVFITSQINSDVTASFVGYQTQLATQAASFTTSGVYHFLANALGLGAGSSVTNQFGFVSESSLTTATNNYAFRGNIASGTGRYNLYMAGTADNYLAGFLGIGSTSAAGYINLIAARPLTGSTNAFSVSQFGTVQSDVTNVVQGFRNVSATAAASFTLSSYQHYAATQGTFGAGSSVTTQYGFIVDATLTGATNNFGFYGGIAAGTNRYNLYMAGTADNYLAGSLGIGGLPSQKVTIQGVSGTAIYQNISNGTQNILLGISAGNIPLLGTSSNDPLLVYTNNSEKMRIDSSGRLGIACTPNASALLDVQSTTQGVRMPNMTTTQKNAISSPAAGLMVFDTTLSKLCVYSGAAWQTIT